MIYGYPSGEFAATFTAVCVCLIVVGVVLVGWFGGDKE